MRAYYYGYDDDAAAALTPGVTANDVHEAGILGKNTRERPFHSGDLNRTVGGSRRSACLPGT